MENTPKTFLYPETETLMIRQYLLLKDTQKWGNGSSDEITSTDLTEREFVIINQALMLFTEHIHLDVNKHISETYYDKEDIECLEELFNEVCLFRSKLNAIKPINHIVEAYNFKTKKDLDLKNLSNI